MANVIEILINAKNNATAEFDKATGSLGKFTTAAGLAGAAGAMAGQAIVSAMQQAGQSIIGNTLNMADNVEMLGRLKSYTGLSVEQLQVFRREIDRNGLSSDQFSMAMRYLREQLNSGDKTLARYGITSRDTFTALQQMSRAMASARDVGERAEIATKALGMRNAELALSVADVAGAYSMKLGEAQRNSAVLSDQQVATFKRLDDAMDNLRDTSNGVKAAMAEMFAPAIEGFAKMLTGLTRFRNDLQELERNQSRQMRARGQTWQSAGSALPMFSGHSAAGGDYDAWLRFFAPGGGSGGGGGASRSYPELNPFAGTGVGGLSIMSRLPDALIDLAQSLKMLVERSSFGGGDGSVKTTEAIEKPLDSIHQAALRFGANIEGAFRSAFSSVLAITSSSTNMVVQMFTALANGILQTVSEMLAEAAARGLIDFALSFVTGGTSAASKVGGLSLGRAGMSPMAAADGGGNTFIISAFNSRDALDDLMNPTGSLRRANDRVRDIGIAQMG